MLITGHQKIIARLERAISQKSVSQSYLFCGPESVGKFLVATDFAEKLTGAEAGKLNRNLLIIAPEVEEKNGVRREREIKIDEIKKLQKEFSLTSFGEKNRVVIIRSAQNLNVAAQNSLLKLLEEPPKKSVLILVAENEKKLLPTIISRCQLVRFNLLPDAQIEAMLAGTEHKEEIVFWSLGRPGLAKLFLADKLELEKQLELADEFKSLFSLELNEKFFLAEKLAKNTPELLDKMAFWIVLLRQSLLGKKQIEIVSPEKALKLIEKIEESKRIIESTNSNARLVLENLLVLFGAGVSRKL